MDGALVLHVGRRTLETAMLLASPILGVTLVVSLLVATMQAVTSIRDMTLGVVIKLACMGVTAMIFGGWMMQVAVSFAKEMFNHLQSMGP